MPWVRVILASDGVGLGGFFLFFKLFLRLLGSWFFLSFCVLFFAHSLSLGWLGAAC
jgi:hypothetical protein